jgi:hypothetical protein
MRPVALRERHRQRERVERVGRVHVQVAEQDLVGLRHADRAGALLLERVALVEQRRRDRARGDHTRGLRLGEPAAADRVDQCRRTGQSHDQDHDETSDHDLPPLSVGRGSIRAKLPRDGQ